MTLGHEVSGHQASDAEVTLPSDLLVPLDRLAEECGVGRNTVLRTLLRVLTLRHGGPGTAEDDTHPEYSCRERLSQAVDGDSVPDEATDNGPHVRVPCPAGSPAPPSELAAQYVQLLRRATAEPDRSPHTFSLLTEEAAKLLPDQSQAVPDSSGQAASATALSRFLDHAAQHPDAPAIESAAGTWTRSELARRAGRIAVALRDAGVAAGEVVAVRAIRGPGLIASLVGIMLAGAVFLPVDARLPPARRRRLMTQASATAEIVLGGPAARCEDEATEPYGALRVSLPVDAMTAAVGTHPRGSAPEPALPEAIPAPDGLAYVFFTSGTTGEPKAVWGRHSGLLHFLDWQARRFAVTSRDRVAQVVAPSFDPFLRDVLLPLTTGAVLCVPEEETLASPDAVLAWLSRERITVLHAVPSLTARWLTAAIAPRLDRLRLTFFAGEPLTDSLVRAWRRHLAVGAELVNLYGPTETTQAKCFYPVPDEPPPGIQPVGTAIPGAQALVLGPHGLCGIGEIGEICVRTPHHALVPDDRAGFVRNPARADPDDLVYRTGDLGRYRADGQLEILGRLDHQVKIHGTRVNPAEVAAALARHPLVEDCVVVGLREQSVVRLTAYVTLRSPADEPERLLRHWALDQLPRAMVPSRVLVLDHLPVTVNGKVDRAALPSPARLSHEDAGAAGAMAQRVGELAGLLLGRPALTPDDDIVDLGGHSLVMIHLLSRIEAECGVRPNFAEAFRHPTPARIARQVEELRSPAPDDSSRAGAQVVSRPRRLSEREADVLLAMLEELEEPEIRT
ncbi:non-ribosomal peptide synthetase [Streptomyces sp. N50]|uniref:non-ribosomal peptide synthetase n=1 Tax=Streptomyces sp. N50 TaxID=3081765 RepID=UPI002962431B|nr:non-ribosomal peptide synthetase [Streptomyces sp. N50]WOX15325.1 non-ribosomal peptide synthetase [Streptomyces sp. N50]